MVKGPYHEVKHPTAVFGRDVWVYDATNSQTFERISTIDLDIDMA